MSIASMTGFARVNGNISLNDNNVSWVWEIKSVNGKSLDLKHRLPSGYDDLAMILKAKAGEIISRGSVSANLEVVYDNNNRKVKIDDVLLNELALKAIDLCQRFEGRLALPSAAEILSQRGVVEIEENVLSDDEIALIKQNIAADFERACRGLQEDRKKEGDKIKQVLKTILTKIEAIVSEVEVVSESLPDKLKEKLMSLVEQHAKDVSISEDRMAQEIVFLVTKADIREEIDRLKTHIKSAYNLLEASDAVGRRLDFLCQELNREANTTCSKACDIAITNMGVELKALIEQFREQVQNIE